MLISIKEKIISCVNSLIVNDSFIIKAGQERAVSSKFSLYVAKEFSEWDVDCEYNRIGNGSNQKLSDLRCARYPDIIIHKRGKKEINYNLLWIEMKIENEKISEDCEKLIEFTSPVQPDAAREVQYQFGLSISFLPKLMLIWHENGKKVIDA